MGGFSRGGIFALKFAFEHPSVVQTVAVFNGAPYAPQIAWPALKGRRPKFYLAAGSEKPQTSQQTNRLAGFLTPFGYQTKLYVAKGVGHSIPSQAVLDTIQLVQEMKTE